MPVPNGLIQGEFIRTLDDRFRLAIPQELADALQTGEGNCVLVKERAGCLSLWPAAAWQAQTQSAVALIEAKIKAGKLQQQRTDVQVLGRLLSTRAKEVQLADRSRLLVPEGFRDFLQVPAGGDVVVVGAALCVEIWNPAAWRSYLEAQLPEFPRMFEQLAS